jgi:hypothetical protein
MHGGDVCATATCTLTAAFSLVVADPIMAAAHHNPSTCADHGDCPCYASEKSVSARGGARDVWIPGRHGVIVHFRSAPRCSWSSPPRRYVRNVKERVCGCVCSRCLVQGCLPRDATHFCVATCLFCVACLHACHEMMNRGEACMSTRVECALAS